MNNVQGDPLVQVPPLHGTGDKKTPQKEENDLVSIRGC